MPNKANQEAVEKLQSRLENTKAIFIADYAGLNVKSQQILRAKVKEAGGELKVTKNTLLKIAMKNNDIDVDTISTELEGQNITLFATDDPIAPLKVVVDFAKEHEIPTIKAGILDKEILSMEKIKQLASLPSKQQLIAQLIGQIKAPTTGLVNVLTTPTRNLVYALSSLKTKLESN